MNGIFREAGYLAKALALVTLATALELSLLARVLDHMTTGIAVV